MTKKKFEILERIFVAEIEDRLPFQFGRPTPKPALKLEAKGMIARMTIHYGPVSVEGWQLTALGHLTYCQNCADT